MLSVARSADVPSDITMQLSDSIKMSILLYAISNASVALVNIVKAASFNKYSKKLIISIILIISIYPL